MGSSFNQSLIEDVSWMKVKVELNTFLKRKVSSSAIIRLCCL